MKIVSSAPPDTSYVNVSDIVIYPSPHVTIRAGGPTKFCQGDSVKLTATCVPGGGIVFQWTKDGKNILDANDSIYVARETDCIPLT